MCAVLEWKLLQLFVRWPYKWARILGLIHFHHRIPSYCTIRRLCVCHAPQKKDTWSKVVLSGKNKEWLIDSLSLSITLHWFHHNNWNQIRCAVSFMQISPIPLIVSTKISQNCSGCFHSLPYFLIHCLLKSRLWSAGHSMKLNTRQMVIFCFKITDIIRGSFHEIILRIKSSFLL